MGEYNHRYAIEKFAALKVLTRLESIYISIVEDKRLNHDS